MLGLSREFSEQLRCEEKVPLRQRSYEAYIYTFLELDGNGNHPAIGPHERVKKKRDSTSPAYATSPMRSLSGRRPKSRDVQISGIQTMV